MVLVKMADATRATQTLSGFASKVTFEDLPREVVREAKRLILDTVGCALGGYTGERSRIVRSLMRNLGGNPQSTLIGSGEKTSCVNAAYANADMANYLDNDDTLLNLAHIAAPVVHTAIPVAERERAAGTDLITAVVVGYDIASRMGCATDFYASVMDGGIQFKETGGYGFKTFGAAVAAGHILRLNEEQMLNAFALAGMLAPAPTLCKLAESVRENPMTKYYVAGWVAQAGLTAALLAQAGHTGPHTILDGERGYWRADGYRTCDFDFMVSQLGEKWWLTEASYKPWPACRHCHPALTVFTKVVRENDIKAEEIEKVVVTPSFAASYPVFWAVEVERLFMLAALVSIPQCLALVAFNVPPGPEWVRLRFKPDDPRLAEFRKKVSYEAAPGMLEALREDLANKAPSGFRRAPTSIEVYARGKVFRDRVEYAKGDPWSPESVMTDDELKEKFRTNALDVFTGLSSGSKRVQRVIDMLYDLEEVKDIRELTALLSP